jgi:hypothetical protein
VPHGVAEASRTPGALSVGTRSHAPDALSRASLPG